MASANSSGPKSSGSNSSEVVRRAPRSIQPRTAVGIGASLVAVSLVSVLAMSDLELAGAGEALDPPEPAVNLPERGDLGISDSDGHLDDVATGDVCVRRSPTEQPCGPTLVDQRSDRASISTLGSTAVIIAVAGEISRLDLPSGEEHWRTVPFAGQADLHVHADPDGVIVSRDGGVARLDANTGAVRWTTTLNEAGAPIAPRAWLIADDVYVLDASGKLVVLDGQDGQPRWTLAGVSSEVVPAADGLLLTYRGQLGLWPPEGGSPLWTLPDAAVSPLRLSPGQVAASPVRLQTDRSLLVPQTGALIEAREGAPSSVRTLADTTLVLRWPGDPDELEVTAYGERGAVRWVRDDLPMSCCLATTIEASDGRIAVGPITGPALLLDRDSGATLAELRRADGELVGISGSLVIWRLGDHVVGEDLESGEQMFRAEGSIHSLEPLIVTTRDGLVHVAP